MASSQWQQVAPGVYRRWAPGLENTHGGGGWQEVSGIAAARLGLGTRAEYQTPDSRERAELDAIFSQRGGAVAGTTAAVLSNPYKDILAQAQAEQDKANAANEARYQQALGISDQMLSTSEGMGQSERADIDTQMANAESKGLQAAISRGLSGTTLRQALMMSRAKNTASAVGALNDRLKATKLNILSGKQNVIASKTDAAPDMSLYAQLLQQMGAGGGGLNGGVATVGGGGGGLRSSLSGGSTSRPRPWSPNWNMSQGLSYQDAVKTASGYTGDSSSSSSPAPASVSSNGFWKKAVNAAKSTKKTAYVPNFRASAYDPLY